MSNKVRAPMASTQVKRRSYLSWTKQMDEMLIEVLRNQVKEGNKAEGEWKPQAYQAVADELRTKLGISTSSENVKNRIKSWKKHYAIISDIRTFSKFRWDEERKMIVIGIEDVEQWTKYVEDHPVAAPYRNKAIEYWDDIVTLYGPDRAVGDGAEMHDEAVVAMEGELLNGGSGGGSSSRSESSSSRAKRQKKDRLADAVNSFADCFRDYVQSKSKEHSRPTPKEVNEVVKNVEGIGRHQVMRATKRFMDGPVHDFEMLKTLCEDEKLDWVLVCLNEDKSKDLHSRLFPSEHESRGQN